LIFSAGCYFESKGKPAIRGLSSFARHYSRVSDEIHFPRCKEEIAMLWTVLVVLMIMWLLGFSLHIGGALIHLLLVVGLVVLVINLLSGSRSAG
jgi:hypothetical protein